MDLGPPSALKRPGDLWKSWSWDDDQAMGAIAASKGGGRSRRETRHGKKGRGAEEGAEMTCRSCGAGNRAGARFCQDCGRSLTQDGVRWLDAQTLTVLGAAGLTLLALGLLFSSVIEMGSTSE